MVEALFTILGTILGFVLSELSTRYRESRNEIRQAKSTRTIVSLEIDLNLEFLKEFIEKANQIDLESKGVEERKKSLAHFFMEYPFPDWSKEAFTSQLSLLPNSLSEQEVIKVFQFYDRLQRIDVIRSNLLLALQLKKSEVQAAIKNNYVGFREMYYIPNTPFNDKASSYWDEGKSLAAHLLAKGNPLKHNKLY
jgi:hypothetical protein